MESRRFLAHLLALVVSGTGAAEATSGHAEILHWNLDGGTTVAIAEDHRVPLVRLVVEFPAGTWSRSARTAHAREAFETQWLDPAGSLRARADRLGANLSLTTDTRVSRLEVSGLKSQIEPLKTLVRDVLRNRDLDRREIAASGRRREFEWKTSEKDPFFVAAQAMARLLFAPDDPRRKGWERPERAESDVSRLVSTRDILVSLPGRVVGFAGDLTRSEAEGFAEELLPPVEEGTTPDLAPTLRPLTRREGREDKTLHLPRLTQAYFAYGRESISYTDPSYPAFLVADHVLGGHFYSRLYTALRHEGGETYGARTANLGDVVIGPYGLGTFTRAGNAAATESKLREVLRTFHREGITEKERADAVGYLTGRRLFDRQSPASVLTTWMLERRLGLPEGFMESLPEKAAATTLEEINRFISRYYDPSEFTMVRVVPKE